MRVFDWYEYEWACDRCSSRSSEPSHEHRVFPAQFCANDGFEMRLVARRPLLTLPAALASETFPG